LDTEDAYLLTKALILMADPKYMEYVPLVSVGKGHVLPPGREPVSGGHEADGVRKLYFAVGKAEGLVPQGRLGSLGFPGKWGEHLDGVKIPYGGREITDRLHGAVLCWKGKPQMTEKEREQEKEIAKLNSRVEELESTESEYASRIGQLEELVGDLKDEVRFAKERSSECENLRSENSELQTRVNAFETEKSNIEESRSWRNVKVIENTMVSCPRNEIDFRTLPQSRKRPST
jgi:hypothetical protein